MPKLKTLWINKNYIEDLDETLAVVSVRCPTLTYLSLLFNPCCPNALIGRGDPEYKRYRVFAKYRIPSLVNLDAEPITAEEAETAKTKGQFMQTKKWDIPQQPAAAAAAAAADAAGSSSPTTATEKLAQSQAGASPIHNPAHVSALKQITTEALWKAAAALFDELEAETTQARGDGAIFTLQRHVYSGKSSEGNRFIGNDVL
jgi:hypothetical protein